MSFLKKISKIFFKENQEISDKENVQTNTPVLYDKKETDKKTVDSTFISKPSVKYGVVVKLKIKQQLYLLEEFDLNFDQPVTPKGKPDGRPRGGIMTLVFIEPLNSDINDWMEKEGAMQNGEIIFFPYKSKTDESALLNISFRDAYCIHYRKEIDMKKGLLTTLVISPRSVKIGNEEFENIWKVNQPLSYNIKSN